MLILHCSIRTLIATEEGREEKLVFDMKANCEEENCSRVKDAGCAGSRPRGLKTHQFENQPFNPNYRTSERAMLLDK